MPSTNGLHVQQPPNTSGLSPGQLYGYPSPSNYADTPSAGYATSTQSGSPGYGNFGNGSFPPADMVLEGYRKEVTDPSIEILRNGRSRNSSLMNLNDPVAMHLLVETAIDDSQEYEVLSLEELESVKKEQSGLASRIEALRRKLALETKVRDAALSLNRLYAKEGRASGVTSATPRVGQGSRGSKAGRKSGSFEKSDDELSASTHKCEQLSRELWKLEIRAKEVQTRLLRHTAGILQLTHAGPKKRNEGLQSLYSDGFAPGARPESPVSLDTYDTGRLRSLQRFSDNFDDRSLYKSAENLDGLMIAMNEEKEPGMKEDGTRVDSVPSSTLLSIEKRLEELNNHLRDLIVEASPDHRQDYPTPPGDNDDHNDGDDAHYERQLNYLEQVLRDFAGERSTLADKLKQFESTFESRIEGANHQLKDIINSMDPQPDDEYPNPPSITGQNSLDQVHFLEDGLYAVEQLSQKLQQGLADLQSRAQDHQTEHDQASRYEAVLASLWTVIIAGEEEARQRKRQRRQMLETHPHMDDGEGSELSPDDDYQAGEEFSLDAFSTKVQWLMSRATNLKEQQIILRRQIRQQRQLNSKSDAERDEQIANLTTDLVQARQQHQIDLQASAERETQLTQLLAELSEARQQHELDTQVDVEKEEHLASIMADLAHARHELDLKAKEISDKEEELASVLTDLAHSRHELDQKAREASQNEEELYAFSVELSQAQQQINIGNQTVAEKEDELASLAAKLDQEQSQHMAMQNELNAVSSQIEQLKLADQQRFDEDNEALTMEREARHQLEDQLATLKASIEDLEDDSRIAAAEINAKLAEATADLETAQASLRLVEADKMAAEARVAKAEEVLDAKEEELRDLEGEFVRLQTEFTVTKAELDAAYGSRAQRAAENQSEAKKEMEDLLSNNAALAEEVEQLRLLQEAVQQAQTEAIDREKLLKVELAGMTMEFEELTRESIEAEKDRERLEVLIDQLRDEKERLEGLLSDEKVRWLGMRSPGGAGSGPGETTSTMVMRQEFRKMMRETRAEAMRALKAEQEERRKLEALVRTLRREHVANRSPVKSNLSQSLTA